MGCALDSRIGKKEVVWVMRLVGWNAEGLGSRELPGDNVGINVPILKDYNPKDTHISLTLQPVLFAS